ncbi:unnamed protein product (macronuclear) [Paramecium tetraurelia]|uniref:Uncharacterized protein n=1 Tax=Paramecium tetraurelia TaxID=5888 RepID=A0CLW2_PARTE|nr:uncharacterized protein GSPATT00038704001 [Paramecium tetraurelia]CAK71779.1 unnamed protein product [Paramecium tetraurelia]|eukprot:XP_001439176.1 hypothetical protein (macronuclear) [Paramecium tetraurelia strain d4-2]
MDQIQYEIIPNANLSNIYFDSVELMKSGVDLVQQPTITKDCVHVQCHDLLNFSDAIQQINTRGFAQCSCGKKAYTKQDLRKDIRGFVREKFHSFTQIVQVIEGIWTHKYQRKKIYTDTICNTQQNNEHKHFIRELYNKYHNMNSISTLIKNLGFSGSYYDFWAYCLLDKIKITIPTRIINCQHPACYELTSLLWYQKNCEQNRQDVEMVRNINDQSIIFHCYYPGCENKIDISTLPHMLDRLFIDQELLEILNSAPSIQFKFQYDLKKNEFKKDFQNKDLYIQDISKNFDDATYKSIMIQIQSIIQLNLSEQIQNKLNQQKYQVRKINLCDPLNLKQVEFPVRCIKCPDFNRCADIRSYVAYFFKEKKTQNRSTSIQCPICKNILQTSTGQLNSLIYFDQNIISRMFKDSSINDNKLFDYDGKQYMLQEFLSKQKFSKKSYTQILKQKKDSNGEFIKEVKFSSLKCTVNPNRRLQYPLIIKNCKKNSYIDFESFYEKLVECQFQIPADGLQLCRCQEYCSINPVKKFTTSVFYHEALGEALQQLRKDNVFPEKFKYNFEEGKFILVYQKQQNSETDSGIDRTIINEGRFNVGFIDLLTDQEYQEAFQPRIVMGMQQQLISMSQNIVGNLHAVHTAEGLEINVDEEVERINKDANQDLKNYQFKVVSMMVDMRDEEIRINRGQVRSLNYQQQ